MNEGVHWLNIPVFITTLQVGPNFSSFHFAMQTPSFIYSTQHVLFIYYMPVTFLKGITAVVPVCVYLCVWQRDREILRIHMSFGWIVNRHVNRQSQPVCKLRTGAEQHGQNVTSKPRPMDGFLKEMIILLGFFFLKKRVRYLEQGMWRGERNYWQSQQHTEVWASM